MIPYFFLTFLSSCFCFLFDGWWGESVCRAHSRSWAREDWILRMALWLTCWSSEVPLTANWRRRRALGMNKRIRWAGNVIPSVSLVETYPLHLPVSPPRMKYFNSKDWRAFIIDRQVSRCWLESEQCQARIALQICLWHASEKKNLWRETKGKMSKNKRKQRKKGRRK